MARVFALRPHGGALPVLAVCRVDSTYAVFGPNEVKYEAGTGRIARIPVVADHPWQGVPMFQTARALDMSWMQAREFHLTHPTQQ